MSDMFESLELNMREEADRVNPTKAILATQLECEQRFESFVAKNPERVDFLSDDIRSVADKYAAEYDIPSETIYEATVTHLKEAAVKKAELFDNGHSRVINDYVGYNMDLEGIEHYWDQYKPLVQSALQNGWSEDQKQLEMELEHLRDELQGIDDEEEGSEKYWALEEEINKALSALYDKGVDQSLEDAREASIKEAEWDKPWTEEDESKEEEEDEDEEENEEKEEEDEEEEKKESSVREAKECNCWDGYKRVPGTKPCSPGSCEKCDSHRKKEAAIEEFLNLHEAALLPDWMRPKEMLRPKEGDLTWRDLLQRSNLYKNPYFMDQGGQEENDPTNPAASKGRSEKKKRNMPAPLPEEGMGMGVIRKEEEDDVFSDLERIEADKARLRNVQQNTERFQRGRDYAQKRSPRQKTFNEYEDQIRATGSVIEDLKEFYVAQGMPEKTASILVEAVGEMAQLQTNEPGLPVGSSDPNSIKIDKEIGGAEGDKYKNLDVAQKQKELGLEHQDFTDFGEPVREFVQPGGEAPYSENTKKRIDKAEQDNLNAKGVKQDDNAPKKSSVKSSNMSVEEIKARIKELEGYTKRDLSAGEAFGPDHGQDDAAYDELHDLKQLLKEKTEDAPKTSARSGLRGMFTDLQLQSIRNHYEDGEGKISPSLLEKCKRLGLCGEDGQFTDKFKQMLDQHVENSGNGPEKLKSLFTLGSEQSAKKSNASVKEASDLSLVPPEGVRSAARRGIKYHSEGKAGDGFESATLARAKKIAEGQELTPEHVKRMHSFFERHAGGRSQKAKQGEITPWDVAWLAWGGNAGRTWAASKVKQMENAKKSSAPLDFDMIDNEVEKLMAGGMTPEQAIQSLGVYNNTNEPIGWGGSKN